MYGKSYFQGYKLAGVPTFQELTQEFSETEAVFTRKERKQYTAYLGERPKPKRKARTLGKEVKARCQANRTA